MADDDRDDYPPIFRRENNNTYNLNNRIMVTAIVSLSAVVVLVTILHIYARCVLRRQSRRRAIIRRIGLTHAQAQPHEPPKSGLDPLVIAALPTFIFKTTTGSGQDEANATECAVCLSVLQNDEMARLLPNCNHSFHVDCIDQWLNSHSSCPICRAEAEPRPVPEPREPAIRAAPPTAPPLDHRLQYSSIEGTSDGGLIQTKVGASSSRLSSFRKMLSRERSSRRTQSCGQDDGIDQDLERQ